MTTQTTPQQRTGASEHPNAARTRGAFAAFSRGDLEAVRQTMADDCTWTIAGHGPLAGTHRGWEEISAMFGRLFELTDGTFSMQVHSIVADDARAVAIYDGTSTVAGSTRTMRFVLVDEVGQDGLTTAAQLLAYDQDTADAHLRGEG